MKWSIPVVMVVSGMLACGDEATQPEVQTDTVDGAETQTDVETDGVGDAEDVAETDVGSETDGAEETDVTPLPEDGWRSLLATSEDLAALSKEGSEVKYLARVPGKVPPAPLTEDCYFQDMHRWQWHIDFLHALPGLEDLPFQAYTSMVLTRATRVLYGGAVKPWPAAVHPRTLNAGVVAYSVYSEAFSGSLTAADLIEADAVLERCIPFAQDLLVFVPTDVAQKQLVIQQKVALTAGDVDVLMPEQLRPGLSGESYVRGEGYGTLLVVPEGEVVRDYGPRDIVIAAAAPNDISIVAGLVTKDPQNVHSHVNLRLAEKQIPSASVAAIYSNALVQAYAGKLVHLVVGDEGVVIEPATLEEAEAFWEARRPTLPEPVADLSVTALTGFDTLRNADAIAFGVKAANLGELHRILPAQHRVEGFGIPFAHYADFIDGHTTLKTEIAAMLAEPRMQTDAAYASARLDALREAIEDAPFPEPLLTAIAARLREVFGPGVDTTRIRFRSSTNAEDLDVISGAGLYDSKSGCLADDLDGDGAGPSLCLTEAERVFLEGEIAARTAELAAHPERVWLVDIIDDFQGDLTKEKPVARAVRKVWASLWNERAFEERSYYGVDHTKVFMGIAVEPSFVLEKANAVAVTNLPATSGGPLYRLVSQSGWLSVVRPEDPLMVAEVLTFHRAGDTVDDVQVLVRSTVVPAGETVWTEGELATIAELLFVVQDHFESEVYPDIAPLALDLEIKRTSDDRIVLKQVRPYLGVNSGD